MTNVQELRDGQNRLLGMIVTRSDGMLEGRDVNNHIKGLYDPKQDETRDRNNHIVGKGNFLAVVVLAP